MAEEMTVEEQVRALVRDPSRYDEIAGAYDDNAVYTVRNLQDGAVAALDTFEEYAEFNRICLVEGPDEDVLWLIDAQEIARSIKNMLLRDSKAGRAYPLDTLSEVEDRLARFARVGHEVPSLRDVVETTVEHLYDKRTTAEHVFSTLSRVLSDVPGTTAHGGDVREAVDFLARARTVARLSAAGKPHRTLAEEATRFRDVVSSGEDTDLETLREANEGLPRFGPERLATQRSVACASGEREDFCEYLFLTGRDVVERYHHADRPDPSRAEVQLAHRQLLVLCDIRETESDDRIDDTVGEYAAVAAGIKHSGGSWLSGRDGGSLPGLKFSAASASYAGAAAEAFGVRDHRFVKYLSKSVRHAGNAATSDPDPDTDHRTELERWCERRRVHRRTTRLFTDLLGELDPAVSTEVQDTIRIHEYERHIAAAYCEVLSGRIERARDHRWEAIEHVETLPQRRRSSHHPDALRVLIDAASYEREGEYAAAMEEYDDLNEASDFVESRRAVIRLKRLVAGAAYEEAASVAADAFGDSSLLTTAARVLAGRSVRVSDVRTHPREIEGMDRVDLLALRVFLLRVVEHGTEDEPAELLVDRVLSV